MKRTDYVALAIVLLIVTFFAYPLTRGYYENAYSTFPLLTTFIKFALLATIGELFVLRIKEGIYYKKEFGIIPKMIIWGILGLFIYWAFAIFSNGVKALLISVNSPLVIAFFISFFMNIIFAPVMMLTHHLTDLHISKESGIFKIQTFSPKVLLKEADWDKMWSFVFKKTIPLFWIPAHTVTFLLPSQYRTLFAALLSVALGLLLAISGLKKELKTN